MYMLMLLMVYKCPTGKNQNWEICSSRKWTKVLRKADKAKGRQSAKKELRKGEINE